MLLLKGFENTFMGSRCDTNSIILNHDAQTTITIGLDSEAGTTRAVKPATKFDRITNQIDNDLTQADSIGNNASGHSRIHKIIQFDTFVLCQCQQGTEYICRQIMEVDSVFGQLYFPSFYFRKIQNFIDNRQQTLS